jgi:tagaturonate epimerase
VPFPFIGANVPEGHQGQSVQGMSHLAVLSKLLTGFHQRRIAWGFNADHQPIGGKFDARETALVEGAILASSITFDLSPELTATVVPADAEAWVRAQVPEALRARVEQRTAEVGVALSAQQLAQLLAQVWPAMLKFQRRDRLYAASRARAFATAVGRAYVRELSIDELPGLTSRETLATMLALCEALDLRVQYVAPAFGFQKNFPFADQAELERRISAAWEVCKAFDVSIGFHSGSGKSADNYRLAGAITGTRLEIKTSGRYTYEMGRALQSSADAGDQALWRAWYDFTRDLAVTSAFSSDATEQRHARQFIVEALTHDGLPSEVFSDLPTCAAALARLSPNPEHMFWFEYNFLFVLAAGGAASKAALGDHTPVGYRQRARFYGISASGRLAYARNVISYLVFLAETTGLVPAERATAVRSRLARFTTLAELLADIAPEASVASKASAAPHLGR